VAGIILLLILSLTNNLVRVSHSSTTSTPCSVHHSVWLNRLLSQSLQFINLLDPCLIMCLLTYLVVPVW